LISDGYEKGILEPKEQVAFMENFGLEDASLTFSIRNGFSFDLCITSLFPMNWDIRTKKNLLKCAKFGFINSITILQNEFEDFVNFFMGYNDRVLPPDMEELFDYIQGNFSWAISERMSGPSGYHVNPSYCYLP